MRVDAGLIVARLAEPVEELDAFPVRRPLTPVVEPAPAESAPAAPPPVPPRPALATTARSPALWAEYEPGEPPVRQLTHPEVMVPRAPAPAPAPALPPAASYVGEPPVSTSWMKQRQDALAALRADYQSRRAEALASPGGPGWTDPAMLSMGESGGESYANPGATRAYLPGETYEIAGSGDSGPQTISTGRWVEFDEAAFRAHYVARGDTPSNLPALQSLGALYERPASGLLADPWVMDLALGNASANAGPAPPGRAMGDAGQLGMLDLYLADPTVQQLIDTLGGPRPAAASSDIAREQVRLYGQARYEQLSRLGTAMATVRNQYTQALEQAQRGGSGPGWSSVERIVPGTVDEWGRAGPDSTVTEHTFSIDAFTAWYNEQDGVANRAFREFYGQSHTTTRTDEIGGESTSTFVTTHETTFDNPAWTATNGGPLEHRDLVGLNPNHAPRLNDRSAVGFDLELGWATARGNIHRSRDWFETLVQVVIVGAVTWASAGTLGPAVAGAVGATGVAGTVVVGAVAGASGALVGGALNDNLSWRGVLRGALAGGLSAGLMQGLGGLEFVTNAGAAGQVALRMTVQGGINALMGGSFTEGAVAGLASGLADAAGANLQQGIDDAVRAGTMSAADAIAARTVARMFTSAVRVLGNRDDPAYAFASEFVGSIVRDGLDATAPGPTGGAAAVSGTPLLDDEGHPMPGVVDGTAPPAMQALQLAERLRGQGMSADEAAALAARSVGGPPQPLPVDTPPEATEASTDIVVIVGRRLPQDALGNRYETDSAGNQVVHLASGGMLALSASAAVPVGPGGVVLTWAALQRLAQGSAAVAETVGSAFMPWALAAVGLAAPGNLGPTTTSVALNENLRFERAHGALYGTLYERSPGGDWLALPERYVGMSTPAGFAVLSEDEYARLSGTVHTPLPPPAGPSGPPPLALPTQPRLDTPGYEATAPVVPGIETYPAEQMRLDDLIVESRGLEPGTPEHRAAAWLAYQQRANDGWDYDRWSSVYDANQARARQATDAELRYHRELGWGEHQVTVHPIVDGQTTPRRLDIADAATQRGIEVKSGYQSATVDNLWELRRDAALVRGGWDIEWVFEGSASQPLIDQLRQAGIRVTIRP